MFHTQGRWLTGLLFQKLFSSISNIEQLKLFRIFSVIGWMMTTVTWSAIFKKWVEWLNMSKQTWGLGSLYFVCSISVCIYIGWASCMEIFLAVLAALLSGHLFFKNLYDRKGANLRRSIIFLSLVLGIVSLFIYQSAFGIFLLPFFLHYVRVKRAKPDKKLLVGIAFYFLTYVVYYFLFKYSLSAYHLEAAERTQVHFDLLKKISFFFAGPFPQGFSMNLLFLARSVFSQIFYVLIFVGWVLVVFKSNKDNSVAANLGFIVFILVLLALIYLPVMIAAENFPSYRTLFPFNLAVFVMVADNLLQIFRNEKIKKLFAWGMATWLLLTAIYTFNFQYINPLKKEYKVLRDFFEVNYTPAIRSVYFIRANKFLFNAEFRTNVYRDEFGAPSTYRDWVPEPMVKQLIFELTKNRKIGEGTSVIQFETAELFKQANVPMDDTALLIDMNRLFKQQ